MKKSLPVVAESIKLLVWLSALLFVAFIAGQGCQERADAEMMSTLRVQLDSARHDANYYHVIAMNDRFYFNAMMNYAIPGRHAGEKTQHHDTHHK